MTLDTSLILPDWQALALMLLTLGTLYGVGRLLTPRCLAEGDWLERLPLVCITGLTFVCGLTALWELERLNYFSLLMMVPLGLSVFAWKAFPSSTSQPASVNRNALFALLITALLCFFATAFQGEIIRADGSITALNMDLGYYGLMAKGLGEAKVASIWSGVFGPATVASGETKDVWYHWGPMWLTSGLSRLTGKPALVILLQVVKPTLNFLLIICAAGIAQALTRWSLVRSLLVGALSVIAVSVPSVEGVAWLASVFHGDVLCHVHPSLDYMFSYQFEALLVMSALACWLRDQRLPAIGLLFCAAVSAPHSVAGVSLMAGVFGLIGLVRKDKAQWQLAAVILATIGLAVLVIHLIYGVGMPKSGDAPLWVLDPVIMGKNLLLVGRLLAQGLLVSLLLLPGLLYLVCRGDDKSRHLGWMALSAMIGSYFAYAMLLPGGERSHFTTYNHAIFVLPIGFWGMARMASVLDGVKRLLTVIAMITMVAFGIHEWWSNQNDGWSLPSNAADLAKVKVLLRREPFGYFTEHDRNWWIPKQAILAGLLNTRCMRLNSIEARDKTSSAAKFYGSSRPVDLVSRIEGEAEAAWSLRLAKKLGIKFILAAEDMHPPEELQKQLKSVLRVDGLEVFEITDSSPPI